MSHKIPDDLSIPEFLRATGPGTQSTFERTASSDGPNTKRPPGIGQYAWEEMQKQTEITAQVELRAAVKQYEDEKRFAEFQQWAYENPELHAMNQKARRDAERRISRLGVKATGRRRTLH